MPENSASSPERISFEEIYRFGNSVYSDPASGHLCWNVEHILDEIIKGLSLCKEAGKTPESVGIDTWGVDYVLLDDNDRTLAPVFSYRDNARAARAGEVSEIIPHERLYELTGIQYQPFNTVYQLFDDRKSGRLDKAKTFLQIPDYLSFRLTGKKKNEYTNATTTSLVNAGTGTWDEGILSALGIDRSLFLPISEPRQKTGRFLPDIEKRVGYSADVVSVPSHDTASAFALACAASADSAVISSGTWSLVGTEIARPILDERARSANFTNEGGIDGSFRFLKNIMGMWLIQQIRKQEAPTSSFDELMELARSSRFKETFDISSPTLLSPDNMADAVRALLKKPCLPLADVMSSVYMTLAVSYRDTVKSIEDITGKKINCIRIVGGGSADRYLNELTEEICGKKVVAGPKEATALGNILSQIMLCYGTDRATALEKLGI